MEAREAAVRAERAYLQKWKADKAYLLARRETEKYVIVQNVSTGHHARYDYSGERLRCVYSDGPAERA